MADPQDRAYKTTHLPTLKGPYYTPEQRALLLELYGETCATGRMLVTGLLIYELRNSQLHDDLIGRGRKIEDELGVDTGVFRGRLKARGILQHDHATWRIYGSALAAWLSAIWLSVRAA